MVKDLGRGQLLTVMVVRRQKKRGRARKRGTSFCDALPHDAVHPC